MTDWTRLAEPFPADEVKQRPGAATWEHRDTCQKRQCRETKDPAKHIQFSYVDARVVAQRLDDVLTPEGWQFTWTHIPGESIVHGRLDIGGAVREDAGYPNSAEDDEPLKAAVSDALKRCAVLFGIGRHLYDDNAHPRSGARPPARSAPPRPTVVRDAEDILEPSDDDLEELHGRANVRDDFITCPIHEVKWAGEPGDLWHKDPEGRYCRHPDNVKRRQAR